jgi:Holliday junction resolvase
MSIYRAAAKRDKNEPEIIAALLAVGASVSQLSGRGLPDLLVGFKGVNYLLEVKNKESGGKLKPDQVEFIASWQGRPVVVVWNVDDALKAIGASKAED